ncbi:MAG: hypothetical protein AB7U23_12450 [Dehalococcoidia bacterium]
MRRYRSRPQFVEAYRYDGSTEGAMRIGAWVRGEAVSVEEGGTLLVGSAAVVLIDTPRGRVRCEAGDYVVKSLEAGFFTVIKAENFEHTFEEVL